VRSALLDTGALVAIVNRRDRFHSQLTDLLKDYDGRFLTTWPVVTRVRDIWTLDRDFLVFRLPDRSRFALIPGGK
jgi:predicted nucleic acid-binding protein